MVLVVTLAAAVSALRACGVIELAHWPRAPWTLAPVLVALLGLGVLGWAPAQRRPLIAVCAITQVLAPAFALCVLATPGASVRAVIPLATWMIIALGVAIAGLAERLRRPAGITVIVALLVAAVMAGTGVRLLRGSSTRSTHPWV